MKYVLYHGNCYDGFGAAYAAWKFLGDAAKYIPVSYGYPPPEMPDAESIHIVDFSYPKEVLLKLADAAPVTVIDHHKTAEESLREVLGAHPHLHTIFDMNKSGALLTWEYFHRHYGPSPADTEPAPAPLLIQHISDRDLWQFKMDGTAKIHKALVSLPMDFKLWDTLDVERLKVEGETCERLYSQLVETIVKSSWIGRLDGKNVPMVNTSIAWSEVGEALLEKYHPDCPMVASFTVFNDQIMWSLRSEKDFDCSEVAKKFGGGGHKNAAGFKTARF